METFFETKANNLGANMQDENWSFEDFFVKINSNLRVIWNSDKFVM